MLMPGDTEPRTKARLGHRRSVRFCWVELRGLRAKAVLAGMGMGVTDRTILVRAVVLWLVSTDVRGRRRVSASRIIDTITRQRIVRES